MNLGQVLDDKRIEFFVSELTGVSSPVFSKFTNTKYYNIHKHYIKTRIEK